jgi:hypothetical protein
MLIKIARLFCLVAFCYRYKFINNCDSIDSEYEIRQPLLCSVTSLQWRERFPLSNVYRPLEHVSDGKASHHNYISNNPTTAKAFLPQQKLSSCNAQRS